MSLAPRLALRRCPCPRGSAAARPRGGRAPATPAASRARRSAGRRRTPRAPRVPGSMTCSVAIAGSIMRPQARGRAAKWPRKNDPDSIRARQEALGLDGEVTGHRPRARSSRAQEMLTGAAVIPVSVVGPLELELGEYELREPGGRARRDRPGERTRSSCRSRTPKAVSRRRSTAVPGRRPSPAASAPTCSPTGSRARRASSAARPRRRSRSRGWIEGELADDARAGSPSRTSRRSRSTRACARSKTHVVGPMCHVLWRLTTGDAVRREHDDPQLLRAEHGLT